VLFRSGKSNASYSCGWDAGEREKDRTYVSGHHHLSSES